MFSTPILYHTARKHVNGRIAKLSHQILYIFELIKTFMNLFSGKTLEKKSTEIYYPQCFYYVNHICFASKYLFSTVESITFTL